MGDLRITDGARDLRAWLTKHATNVPDFCARHDLDRVSVQRVLNGERWKRITVDFADKIEKATAGAVKWNRWRSATGRKSPAA